MFFIINNTKQSLSISDLKLILGPRQAIDLDGQYSRDQIDNSKGLSSLISKGLIVVKNKTEREKVNHEVAPITHNENLSQIKDEILNGVSDIIAKNIQKKETVNDSLSNINLEDFAKLVASMVQNSNQNNSQDNQDSYSGDKKNNKYQEQDEINNDILADIHSRAVNKMVKNVTSDIMYQKEQTENHIDENISELEQLLNMS